MSWRGKGNAKGHRLRECGKQTLPANDLPRVNVNTVAPLTHLGVTGSLDHPLPSAFKRGLEERLQSQ
eukprot:2879883-Alexandrium_andersonii.AAC.1